MRVTKKCESYGCTRTVFARGLCGMHYNRERTTEFSARPDVPDRPKWEYENPSGERELIEQNGEQ